MIKNIHRDCPYSAVDNPKEYQAWYWRNVIKQNFYNMKLGETQYVVVTSFEDDEGKTHVVLKPAICFYCGEKIIKFEGHDSDSILIHSIDLNHENIAPENPTISMVWSVKGEIIVLE